MPKRIEERERVVKSQAMFSAAAAVVEEVLEGRDPEERTTFIALSMTIPEVKALRLLGLAGLEIAEFGIRTVAEGNREVAVVAEALCRGALLAVEDALKEGVE